MKVRICPNCKSKDTKVFKTIDEGSRVLRYRHCNACRFTWKTVEILLNDYDALKKVEA